MPIYPKAVYKRPPNMTTSGRRAKTDCVIWHIDAGNVYDLYGWWNNPNNGGNGSQFHVAKDGTVFQYADTDLITWTSYRGSRRSIGIETQGYGSGEWTPAQRQALIDLTRWLCQIYDIPMRAMTSSKTSERGIGWHTLGVPASARQKALGRSQTGGELWSTAVGKVCPGYDRVRQIPAMVREIAGGGNGDIKKAQQSLVDLGYYVGDVDGIAGPITQAATKNYQRDAGLVADGIIGPKTTQQLESDMSKINDIDKRTKELERLLKSNRRVGASWYFRVITSIINEVRGIRGVLNDQVREIHFKTECDDRWCVAWVGTGTWARVPNEDTWKRHNGVLDHLKLSGTPAIQTWEQVSGAKGSLVTNPKAFGIKVEW